MPDEATTDPVTSARTRWWLRKRPLLAGAAVVMALLLAALASWLASPSPGRPSAWYLTLPDPCALVSAAHVGRYAPGAQPVPLSLFVASGIVSGTCTWSAGRTVIDMQVTLDQSAADAARTVTPQGTSSSVQSVAGLGDRAVADLTVSRNVRTADLSVQYGNAVITVNYTAPAGRHAAAAMRSAATALASAALAALPTAPAATAAATGFPASARPGSPYARPASACALVRPALLAGSLPGAAVNQGETAVLSAGSSGTADCDWTAASGTLTVDVAVLGPAPAPRCPKPSPSRGPDTFTICQSAPAEPGIASFYGPAGSTQRISGLGDQATAYVAAPSSPSLIVLTADAGNAVVTADMHWTGQLAQAKQLAETTAVVRDVLGALPRSR